TVASTAHDTVASTSQSTTVPSKQTTVAPIPSTTVASTVPSTASASKLKKGRKDPKDLIRPKEDYGTFDPSRILPEDPKLKGCREDDKKICWFFLLTLLMDPTKKEIVAWTGRGREFV
ncbi:hypothetical protein PFISCL1PPCAC_12355, partial [Pristionchus fissidentatus]